MPYKQPPEGTRFKKGASGNPSGRPKRRATFFDELLEELQKPAPGEGCSNRRAIAKRLVSAARDGHLGSTTLIIALLDRFESPDPDTDTDQQSAAEADIIEHVLDPSPAKSDKLDVPQLLPPPNAGGGDSEASS